MIFIYFSFFFEIIANLTIQQKFICFNFIVNLTDYIYIVFPLFFDFRKENMVFNKLTNVIRSMLRRMFSLNCIDLKKREYLARCLSSANIKYPPANNPVLNGFPATEENSTHFHSNQLKNIDFTLYLSCNTL